MLPNKITEKPLLLKKKSLKPTGKLLSKNIPEVKLLEEVASLSAMKLPTSKLKKFLLPKSFPKPL